MRRPWLGLILCGVVVSAAEAQPGPEMPRARSLSGSWQPEEGQAAGTAVVRLTYDDLADAKPPAGVEVVLVGYAADGKVEVKRAKTAARGVATFERLDTSGQVAYYALAQLPRNKRADRLHSAPLVLGTAQGARLLLSAERRSDKRAPPIDERLPQPDAPPPAPPKGRVNVILEGVPEKGTAVELLDAATGKVVARGEVAEKELVLSVAPRAGQVLYVEAVSRGQRYRSAPVLTVADRGATAAVMIYPRIMATFRLSGEADDTRLEVRGEYQVRNTSFIPYADGLPLRIPFPRGAQNAAAILSSDPDHPLPIAGGAFPITRALPPGGESFRVYFELPVAGDAIAFDLELPHGSFQSAVYVDAEGTTVTPPAGMSVTSQTTDRSNLHILDNIALAPGKHLSFTVHPPRLGKAESALAAACRPLSPDRHSALRGKPAPALPLNRADGKPFKLSDLRGKPVLISFMSSWDALSAVELPTIEALQRAFPDLQVITVASDADPVPVLAKIGKRRFHVLLDPPVGDTNIGATTTAWGVPLLPESFLIDRKGTVRFYFPNRRDWSSADALACVKAVAGS